MLRQAFDVPTPEPAPSRTAAFLTALGFYVAWGVMVGTMIGEALA